MVKKFKDFFILYLKIVEAIGPILDNPPVNFKALIKGSFQEKLETLPSLRALVKSSESQTHLAH